LFVVNDVFGEQVRVCELEDQFGMRTLSPGIRTFLRKTKRCCEDQTK
jgi:hypothetical protein